MKRRDFLKMSGFMTVSVAALGVTACGSSDGTTPNTIAPNPVRPEAPKAPVGSLWLFPQSVATGDPRPDSVVFWTRVVPASHTPTQESTTSVALQLRVTDTDNSGYLGTNTALSDASVADVTVSAYGDFDGSLRHKLTGLDAATTYFYQFVVVDEDGNDIEFSKIGRTKTAPATSSSADVKFAFMSCQDWNANHWGAFTQIVADDGAGATPSLDFIVHLGDYIYETSHTAPGSSEALHAAFTLPSGNTSATTTEDYRFLYKTYRADTRLQAMHERFPMIAIWDDHEFSDDSWGDHETSSNLNPSQPDRRRSANQAWFEYMPADVVFSENDPSFQNIKIYRDLQFGQVMHLVMTDERLYRADHMIPETTAKPGTTGATPADQLGRINSRYLTPEASYKMVEAIKSAPFPADPLKNISILGSTQRQWWKDTMSNSSATWKVWGNEVSLLRMGLNGVNALGNLIGLGIINKLVSPDGIAKAATDFSAATAANLQAAAGAPASVATAATAQVPSIATILAGAGTYPDPVGSATTLAGQAAGAIAMSAAGGGDNTAKFTAAATVLNGNTDVAASGQVNAIASAAVGAFNKAVAVGTIAITAPVVAAAGQGATTPIAGKAAFAITAKSADPSVDPVADLPGAIAALAGSAVAAGLTATQAQAAAAAYLNAIKLGNTVIASALAGAATTGADTTVAGQAALAITAADANPAAQSADRIDAAVYAGLDQLAAETAVAAFEAAKAAKLGGGTDAQQTQAAAQAVGFGKARPDIITNEQNSPFYITATGPSAAAVAGFFQKFLINADIWDGYQMERKELMNYLLDEGINNVVGITGDIHAFFAGEVYNDFAGEVTSYTVSGGSAKEVDNTASAGGQAAMVDLVVAGISSTSWFNYLKEAVDVLDSTNALIGKLVYVPVPVAIPANGLGFTHPAMNFTVNLNTLNYAMGKNPPATAAALASELTDQLRRNLAANGIPEGFLGAAAAGVAGMIAANASFQGALALAQTLSTQVAANPWLKHVDTEAQGYAVVTASTGNISCEFKKLNPLVGTNAPATVVASTKTATINAGSTSITMS